MTRRKRQLRTRNGIWVERGQWEPVYVREQQKGQGIEYQTYALDFGGRLVHAGVTRHERMNQAVANQIQRVWARWRKEYDTVFSGKGRDYPAKYVQPVVTLVVFPVDSQEEKQTFAV